MDRASAYAPVPREPPRLCRRAGVYQTQCFLRPHFTDQRDSAIALSETQLDHSNWTSQPAALS
jgi:hypothetical protein